MDPSLSPLHASRLFGPSTIESEPGQVQQSKGIFQAHTLCRRSRDVFFQEIGVVGPLSVSKKPVIHTINRS